MQFSSAFKMSSICHNSETKGGKSIVFRCHDFWDQYGEKKHPFNTFFVCFTSDFTPNRSLSLSFSVKLVTAIFWVYAKRLTLDKKLNKNVNVRAYVQKNDKCASFLRKSFVDAKTYSTQIQEVDTLYKDWQKTNRI